LFYWQYFKNEFGHYCRDWLIITNIPQGARGHNDTGNHIAIATVYILLLVIPMLKQWPPQYENLLNGGQEIAVAILTIIYRVID